VSKICFNIVTHNRRQDFNQLIASIEDNIDMFNKFNVDIVVLDNESDKPVRSSHLHKLHRVNDQKESGGLVGAWEFITNTYIRDYEYFVYSNHDVVIDSSIGNFFWSLHSQSGNFVMGPTSNPGGANVHQNGEPDLYDAITTNTRRMKISNPIENMQLVHGFFWATNKQSLETAKYSTYKYFNPLKPFAGCEDDWQMRLYHEDNNTKFLIEKAAYVKHTHYSDWKKHD